MKNFPFVLFSFIILLVAFGCQSIKQSSKYGFNEGFYKSRIFHKKEKRVYVIPEEDSIKVYSAKTLRKGPTDTVKALKIAFPANERPAAFESYVFTQNTFDIDVLSILFKYRPAVKDFPNVFNASILNGAIYLGYRTDSYHLLYKQTPFKTYKRDITHYDFSLGIFTGIGAARIDEYVTRDPVDIQYDGFVNPSGVAAIVGVDKLSFGLLVGVDHLLDKNHKRWIYQGKPWVGLSLGLNLN